MPGPTELVIVLVIILVIFGGAKLPKLAKSLGEAQREFKKGTEEGEADKTTASASAPVVEKDTTEHGGPIS
ncbi:MAG: Sec-independent protein translocase protein TatA [Acidimicrobiales bacterium]|nr:Sec-independent protein translocase protein TatA [Acidimicrobiales bacterium]